MYREAEMTAADVALLHQLWTGAVEEEDFVYKALTKEEIEEKLLTPSAEAQKLTLIDESGKAFISGTYVEGQPHGYITMIYVVPELRRNGTGRKLLEAFESAMKERFGVSQLRIIFFNPVTLVWNIPGKPGCEHPNSPGVDTASPAYPFFQAMGYTSMALENSYYVRLKGYEIPQALQDAERKLSEDGYEIKAYDPETMHGLVEMLEAMGNSMMLRDIGGEKPPKEGGRLILVPVKDGKVVGVTGPLDVEPSGRGYFAGIAIAPEARQRGIAKVLFAELCNHLHQMGASYMTLFTGDQNPARRIYEAAGFEIVRSWDDMKKDL